MRLDADVAQDVLVELGERLDGAPVVAPATPAVDGTADVIGERDPWPVDAGPADRDRRLLVEHVRGESELVYALARQGADRKVLEDAYFAYTEARNDTSRVRAAMDFATVVQQQAQQNKLDSISQGGSVTELSQRVDRMGQVHGELLSKRGQWENTAGGFVQWTLSDDAAERLVTSDLDSDGDVDVLLGRQEALNEHAIAFVENLGPGFGVPSEVARGSTELHRLAVGDLEADGDPDVLIAAASGVHWAANQLLCATADTEPRLAGRSRGGVPARVVEPPLLADPRLHPDRALLVPDGSRDGVGRSGQRQPAGRRAAAF